MKTILRIVSSCAAFMVSLTLACVHVAAAADDPLPSWNEGAAKRTIVNFVQRVTTPGGKDFVPEPERIATFDNDGTLWAEQPIYFQFAFALDRVKALAPQHPQWKTTQPFRAAIAGDLQTLTASGEKGLLQIMAATHAGMTTDEFHKTVAEWIASARHPSNSQFEPYLFRVILGSAEGSSFGIDRSPYEPVFDLQAVYPGVSHRNRPISG